MPKEIEQTPPTFHQELPYLRMEFDELVTLLEKINIDNKEIYAISNNAEFVGLEDIKTTPSRFSGEPYLRVTSMAEGMAKGSVSIEFNKVQTVVSAGTDKGGYNLYKKEDNDFAKLIYQELVPFSSSWEWWAGKILGIASIIMYGLIVVVLFETFSDYSEGFGSAVVKMISTGAFQTIITMNVIVLLAEKILRQRVPIRYNPRITFWEKHGVSTLVGICSSVITALIVWFLKGS